MRLSVSTLKLHAVTQMYLCCFQIDDVTCAETKCWCSGRFCDLFATPAVNASLYTSWRCATSLFHTWRRLYAESLSWRFVRKARHWGAIVPSQGHIHIIEQRILQICFFRHNRVDNCVERIFVPIPSQTRSAFPLFKKGLVHAMPCLELVDCEIPSPSDTEKLLRFGSCVAWSFASRFLLLSYIKQKIGFLKSFCFPELKGCDVTSLILARKKTARGVQWGSGKGSLLHPAVSRLSTGKYQRFSKPMWRKKWLSVGKKRFFKQPGFFCVPENRRACTQSDALFELKSSKYILKVFTILFKTCKLMGNLPFPVIAVRLPGPIIFCKLNLLQWSEDAYFVQQTTLMQLLLSCSHSCNAMNDIFMQWMGTHPEISAVVEVMTLTTNCVPEKSVMQRSHGREKQKVKRKRWRRKYRILLESNETWKLVCEKKTQQLLLSREMFCVFVWMSRLVVKQVKEKYTKGKPIKSPRNNDGQQYWQYEGIIWHLRCSNVFGRTKFCSPLKS